MQSHTASGCRAGQHGVTLRPAASANPIDRLRLRRLRHAALTGHGHGQQQPSRLALLKALPGGTHLAGAEQLAAGTRQLILGIESSCDDTGAAVVTSDGYVLGEALATQAEIHAPWGGVVPHLATQAHQEAIDRIVDEALQRAGVQPKQLTAVAVTVGPGLGLCLRVGALKALSLSAQHQLPLVRVHHMEAHALVARMNPDVSARPAFPFLCLLVSGGHNLLVLARGVGDYVQLGTTLDDALGEAYDKIARMLDLDMRPSGGAALEALARGGDPHAFKFVVPMRKRPNCDFSFAGLKTSVRLAIQSKLGLVEHASQRQPYQPSSSNGAPAADLEGPDAPSRGAGTSGTLASATTQAAAADASSSTAGPDEAARAQIKADIAASFQHTATQHLIERLERGIKWARSTTPGIKHLVVAGGVACNQHIRGALQDLSAREGITLVLPPPKHCTDNGAMVAWAGLERLQLGLQEAPVPQGMLAGEDTWVDLKPRWPLTSEIHPGVMSEPDRKAKKPPAAANEYGARSARKARLHTSLTELTAQQLATLQQVS